ncbi:YcaO-like family protein [Pseudomonas sp. 18173]|uniref:YcaO-like family protein n=1 Tax=Pseudomonas sp. 18173 TaxID=3390055 RepID=UPI003D1AC9EF
MNIFSKDTNSALPREIFIQPPCVFNFPFCVEVGDQWQTVGSGVGNSSESITTALGEYFERRHFYLEVLRDCSSSLEKCLRPAEVKKFIKAFDQTASSEANLSNLACRKFNMSSVVRISDFSKCAIPTICISLSHHGNEDDNSIYPSRDTCGCSFHKSYESAIFGSIKELLERQFLTRFWLTKQCIGLVTPNQISKMIKATSAYGLYNALLKSGKLAIIDISDDSFPGVCLLTVYGSDNPSRNIHYCAGMSYAINQTAALEKSILELWQTFRFMNLFRVFRRNPDSLQDPYIRHFMKCDTYTTFKEITSNIKPSNSTPNKQTAFGFDTQGLIQALKSQNIEAYLYIKTTKIGNTGYTFCKSVSPSLFMHMDNSKNINLANDYSARFSTSIDKARKEQMVPFP